MKIQKRLMFYIIGLAFITAVARADVFYWTNDAGGNFQDPNNWSPNQMPGTNDTVIFSQSNTYTVFWTGSVTNHTVIVSAGSVTFDLQGFIYSLDRESSNTIGTLNSPTMLTVTNGTIQRLNPGYIGNFKPTLYLRGAGTTLRVLNAVCDRIAYYPWIESNTAVIVSGTGASLRTLGYVQRLQGTVIVTNGASLVAGDGLSPGAGGFIHVHGTGTQASIAFGGTVGIHSNATVRFDGGAVIQGIGQYQNFEGNLTLQNARYYYYFLHPDYGWIYLKGNAAMIQGTGTVEMSRIILSNGTIRVGETNQGGTLTFTGLITNAPPGTGTLQIALGGSGPPAHGQLVLKASARGPGKLFADGIHLEVSLIPGFQPTAATIFKIIDAVEIVGTFATITLPSIAGQWITADLYTKGEIAYRPPPRGTLITIR